MMKQRLSPAMQQELETVRRIVAPETPIRHELKAAIAGLFIAKMLGHNVSDYDD